MNFSTTFKFFHFFPLLQPEVHCFLQFFSIQYILQIDQTKTKMFFVCLFVSRVFVCLFSIFVRICRKKKDLPFSFDAFFRDQIYCIDLFLKDKTAYIGVERAKRIIKRIYLPFLLLISSKLYLSAVICIYFSWTFGIKFQIASSPSNLPKQSVNFVPYIGILTCWTVWHIWMTWRNS